MRITELENCPPPGHAGDPLRWLSELRNDDAFRSEHTRRSLTEKEAAAAEKDRLLAELQRQVVELQSKVGGAAGSTGILGGSPAVVSDNRPGASSFCCSLHLDPPMLAGWVCTEE